MELVPPRILSSEAGGDARGPRHANPVCGLPCPSFPDSRKARSVLECAQRQLTLWSRAVRTPPMFLCPCDARTTCPRGAGDTRVWTGDRCCGEAGESGSCRCRTPGRCRACGTCVLRRSVKGQVELRFSASPRLPQAGGASAAGEDARGPGISPGRGRDWTPGLSGLPRDSS